MGAGESTAGGLGALVSIFLKYSKFAAGDLAWRVSTWPDTLCELLGPQPRDHTQGPCVLSRAAKLQATPPWTLLDRRGVYGGLGAGLPDSAVPRALTSSIFPRTLGGRYCVGLRFGDEGLEVYPEVR